MGSFGSLRPILYMPTFTPWMACAFISASEGRSLPQALSVSGTQSGNQETPHVILVPPKGLPGLIPYWAQGHSVLLLILTLTPDRTWGLPAFRPEALLLTARLLTRETQNWISRLAMQPHALRDLPGLTLWPNPWEVSSVLPQS